MDFLLLAYGEKRNEINLVGSEMQHFCAFPCVLIIRVLIAHDLYFQKALHKKKEKLFVHAILLLLC
jgi:hypothetical protein